MYPNYSPSGKLVQIEYALAAVAAGAPAVAIKAKDGAVLATEKKHKSILVEEHSILKVENITNHIGMVYSGECWLGFRSTVVSALQLDL